MTIRTVEDWWTLCDAHWQSILDIFSNVGAPMGRGEQDHWWCDGIGKEATRHDQPLVRLLEELKEKRDPQLVRFFNLAWIAAPDESYIHSWPSWGAFCDLCSEEWVFHEEGGQ